MHVGVVGDAGGGGVDPDSSVNLWKNAAHVLIDAELPGHAGLAPRQLQLGGHTETRSGKLVNRELSHCQVRGGLLAGAPPWGTISIHRSAHHITYLLAAHRSAPPHRNIAASPHRNTRQHRAHIPVYTDHHTAANPAVRQPAWLSYYPCTRVAVPLVTVGGGSDAV